MNFVAHLSNLLRRVHGKLKSQDNRVTNASSREKLAPLPLLAQQLAKDCILLKRAGTELAAVWGGTGTVPAPPGAYQHWLSVDSCFLPGNFYKRPGVLSIYADDDSEFGVTVFQEDAVLLENGGEYLYAYAFTTLPPPDASPVLDNNEYLQHWLGNCSIYTLDGTVAVLGGWHFPWPDGDWEELASHQLLAMTIENSEPWVEAWQIGGTTKVIQRVT